MSDKDLYVNLTEQQEDGLTKIELDLEAGIEHCLSVGCNINDIKDTIDAMVEKYEADIARRNFRERIREHNERLRQKKDV